MKKGDRERFFLKNGGVLLEELIASCDGRCNPIRNFSAKDLIKATNNFDSHNRVSGGGYYELYKGSVEDRPILVKMSDVNEYVENGLGWTKNDHCEPLYSEVIRDIVITSQMSNHKNVLKLLGCCLEFKIPALVCEYAGDVILSHHLNGMEGGQSLSWKSRIRIAKDIANAVAYLHTAFPRPIIHRNFSPRIVFLNEHGVVKLFDFTHSISIRNGEPLVVDYVSGTSDALDPEYLQTFRVTEKVDVFSFGRFLLVLLTGQKLKDEMARGQDLFLIENYLKDCVDKDRFNDIVDPKILGEGGGIEQERQLQAFVELALRCTQARGEDRPEMIDVGKELMRIERSIAVLPC